MKHILRWAEGEVLSLGPPLPGTVALLVRSEAPGGSFVFGTRVMARDHALATHRFLSCDVVYIIQKGQGRATVEGHSMTVVSGMTISVPRQQWHALQNTGTGELHVVWLAVPAGVEGFLRELAQQRAEPTALQQLAGRYDVEFHTAQEPPAVAHPQGGSRRHRRGGRGRRSRVPTSGAGPQPISASTESPPAVMVPPVSPASAPTAQTASASPARPRHHRRHRRSHRSAQRSAATTSAPSASEPSTPPPTARDAAQAPPAKSHGPSRHRRGKVKEVYMGGRWIRVSGEGPVIAPGS